MWYVDEIAADAWRYIFLFHLIIYSDITFYGVEQGKYESYDSRLSGSRFSEDSCAGVWLEVERKVVYDVSLSIIVGIGDVAELYTHTAFRLVQVDGFALFLKRVLLQFHESFGSSKH